MEKAEITNGSTGGRKVSAQHQEIKDQSAPVKLFRPKCPFV